MPDLGGGHQLEHRVHHAKTGPQDRHEPDPVAELVGLDLLERGADAARSESRVGERLVARALRGPDIGAKSTIAFNQAVHPYTPERLWHAPCSAHRSLAK